MWKLGYITSYEIDPKFLHQKPFDTVKQKLYQYPTILDEKYN